MAKASRRVAGGRFRNLKQLSRKGPSVKAGKRLLIVCEGSKTEPAYFKAMRKDLGLTGTDVRVCGEECGTDPISVLEFALELWSEDRGFDEIYCVFDKEGTPERKLKYDQACERIKNKDLGKNTKIVAIRSVPCFEYWYILHFNYHDAPFSGAGKKSAGDMVVDMLKRKIPRYEKSDDSVYDLIKDDYKKARKAAIRSQAAADAAQTDNPTTNVHLLVHSLRVMGGVEEEETV
ncbi:MAG: CRISPR-associated protein [Novosphingobium pentaromativorans]|uniref:CRISPR-associated protein n=1 Tax=Novosphingobium pentaromativorans TaxID=205844 RepID=A0A2W5NXE1_9SPHN|nr:MAG: CRISPR-associated protein [Novosphingobium pentaromativorans]